jgi:hypothetical protein
MIVPGTSRSGASPIWRTCHCTGRGAIAQAATPVQARIASNHSLARATMWTTEEWLAFDVMISVCTATCRDKARLLRTANTP